MNASATSESSVLPPTNVVGCSEPSTILDDTADLVARIRGGDQVALEMLINRILPSLRRIGHRRLAGHARTLLDIDDLVQDALVSLVRRLPHFVCQSPGSLLAYLQRVIVSRIIDAKRKRARQGEWIALSDECAGQAASPLQRVLDKEEILRYQAALLRLKPRERQLIVMRVERQLTYQEMATQLHVPSSNAARVALIRAMARLVAALEAIDSIEAPG